MNFDQYVENKKIPVAKIHPWFLNVPSQYPITLEDGTKIIISNVTDLTVDMDIWERNFRRKRNGISVKLLSI